MLHTVSTSTRIVARTCFLPLKDPRGDFSKNNFPKSLHFAGVDYISPNLAANANKRGNADKHEKKLACKLFFFPKPRGYYSEW